MKPIIKRDRVANKSIGINSAIVTRENNTALGEGKINFLTRANPSSVIKNQTRNKITMVNKLRYL